LEKPIEFLVRIDTEFPPELTTGEISKLYAMETAQAKVLATEGTLVRLWRIPGRRSNLGLWQAEDATSLHEALTSLLLRKYMDVEVTAMARHPNDPGVEQH
jgi:muconolactone D-isomerase